VSLKTIEKLKLSPSFSKLAFSTALLTSTRNKESSETLLRKELLNSSLERELTANTSSTKRPKRDTSLTKFHSTLPSRDKSLSSRMSTSLTPTEFSARELQTSA